MAQVRVTAVFTPEPDEVDESDPTGLTEKAYNEVMSLLAGFDNVDIEMVGDDE